MTTDPSNQFDLEREIISVLCNAALANDRRANALQDLTEYPWRASDHRVIYEALRRSRERDAIALHEYLKAEVTRLGFPDIDWALYFNSRNPASAEIEILVHALLAREAEAPDQSS